MEYHCSNDKDIAIRIFEIGLRTFSAETEFIIHYLEFLISINDENSKRSSFHDCLLRYINSQ